MLQVQLKSGDTPWITREEAVKLQKQGEILYVLADYDWEEEHNRNRTLILKNCWQDNFEENVLLAS